ncbi:hypothetical protein TWF730_000135 [Orbilia blumenaviensis]|uniref:Uncharacterized protein n=1 Tax=Orbilia blumenaviensis TaxID=1796055 RepID=A0AAV9VKM1_9PEZI
MLTSSHGAHATTTKLPKRRCQSRASSASTTNLPLASTPSGTPLNSERIKKVKELINNDHDYYHPLFAPHTPVQQKRSWPLVTSIHSFPKGYLDYIEDSDLAPVTSSRDSGVDIYEYDTETTLHPGKPQTKHPQLAYIGAWCPLIMGTSAGGVVRYEVEKVWLRNWIST